MKGLLKNAAMVMSTASILAVSATMAAAQDAPQKGTDASYVGGGISAGVTHDGQPGNSATFGGNIQGRLAIPNVPISARGAVLFSSETSAIMPIVSYDIPVANNVNVYVGGGYSFVERDGKSTPLGNRNAPVVTVGGEAHLGSNIVVYGDGKWGINAYQNSQGDALSFQAGMGYRF
ncbi:outer membrane beta-barrel protein [Spirulina subsalsa]|uniref:outer membrane beta-barrel protein n=1 Tax=Spirulina subsalsa TaxID=54311 RepID=UPI00031F4213|nr:outer membrane beta-barrel protein [Spirulina subsalsa]